MVGAFLFTTFFPFVSLHVAFLLVFPLLASVQFSHSPKYHSTTMSESHSGFEPVVRDCLVGIVADDADLKRFRDEGWYRVPDRALGRSLSRDALQELRALALYQTGTITDGLPGAIELWGEITAIDTLRRRDLLPDQPNHPAAAELYHCVRVRSVQHLQQPIISRLPRRITFLRTTQQHLLHAVDLNDLVVGSPAEERLWHAVRETYPNFNRNVFMQVNGVLMEVDFGLVIGEMAVAVLCRDEERVGESVGSLYPEAWRVIRFSASRIENELEECVREIMLAAEEVRREVGSAR